jgi:hypothetical protein
MHRHGAQGAEYKRENFQHDSESSDRNQYLIDDMNVALRGAQQRNCGDAGSGSRCAGGVPSAVVRAARIRRQTMVMQPARARPRIGAIGMWCACVAPLILASRCDAQSDYVFANGFEIPATLLLNEVGANISSSRDLIELRAIGAGLTVGIAVIENPASGGGGSELAPTEIMRPATSVHAIQSTATE